MSDSDSEFEACGMYSEDLINGIQLNEDEEFKTINEIDLDKVLKLNENRVKNKFGLYRLNCFVVGKTGSGKTTTLLKCLLSDVIDEFGVLIFLIPRESMNSGFYKSLSEHEYINVKGNRVAVIFYIIGEDDLPSVETISDISKEIGKFKRNRIALILDDFVNVFNKNDWLLFKRYVTQLSRVPNGCSLFVLTQSLNPKEMPPTVRKNFNCYILFVNSLTLLQFKDLIKSYFDILSFTKDELEKLFYTFKEDPHTPLYLINNGNPNKCMMFGDVWISKK